MRLKNARDNKKFLMTILSLSLVAVLFVPVLYSFIYLDSIWDVYGDLDTVPVAVVNLDKPVTKDCKEYAVGRELEENLRNNDKLSWQFVSHEEAVKGVEGTKYYALIEVPEDFSEKISEAQDGSFESPELIYMANEGRNFVFSQLSSKIAESIKNEVSSSIQKEVSKALVDSLYDVKVSINDASEGASDLHEGTEVLLSGSADLSKGLNEAAEGSKQLTEGLQTIKEGQSQITNGAQALVDGLNTFKSSLTSSNDQIPLLVQGSAEVSKNTELIEKGAEQLSSSLNTGLNALADGINQTASGISQASAILNAEVDNIKKSNLSEEDKAKLIAVIGAVNKINSSNLKDNIEAPLRKAAGSAEPLASNLKKLSEGTKSVAAGTLQLAQGLADTQSKVAAGSDKLIEGAQVLQQGSSTILNGMDTAVEKTGQLSKGLEKLSSGSVALKDGLQQLNDGTAKFSESLKDGYDKISSNLKFDSENMSQFISDPVALKDNSINQVDYYGEGLSPYFISLSLWIGAMFISLIFSIAKSLKAFDSKFMNSFIGKFVVGSALTAVQAVILTVVVVKGLNLKPVSVPEFYLSNIFIAIVFFGVMYGLSHAIGVLGAPIMFVVLILQLASSAGTFPIETAPRFYQVIGKFVPMTYSVSILRMIISGINSSLLNKNISAMLIFAVVFLGGGFIIRTIINLVKGNKQAVTESQAA
ncbi:YhgE/Pip domain-containing protein [Clostridium thermarum]|uniref:YhgE/Pip domain-containing protein n=1 Tax=Clostridium thermarum TaxID=1716543 RepID=UPI001124587A|nr:YhgE/Pip domain-containing protein [Clostridium thermarum]